MADLNAELLRALDGAAPQHKKYGEQAFEFTEGEQGKLFTGNHVMTDSGIWVPQKGSDDGAADVQLTGRKVEEILPRAIRDETIVINNIEAPENAKGLIAAFRVYGVTGTFDSGEGLDFWTRTNAGRLIGFDVATNAMRMASGGITSSARILHIWCPGASIGDAEEDVGYAKVSGIPPQDHMNVRLGISGTFEEGEGFDCRLTFTWII